MPLLLLLSTLLVLQRFTSQAVKPFVLYLVLINVYVVLVNVIVIEKIAGNLRMQVTY